MLKITITRESGNLGLTATHCGVNDEKTVYEEICGNVDILRRSLNKLLDEIKRQEEDLVRNLGIIANNFRLPPSVRIAAQEEKEKWKSRAY